jgi:hypothetical protein
MIVLGGCLTVKDSVSFSQSDEKYIFCIDWGVGFTNIHMCDTS